MKRTSEEKQEEIRQLRKQGLSLRAIARQTGVSQTAVKNISNGRKERCSGEVNIPKSMWQKWDKITEKIRR